jgi:hypothetical protein
MASVTSSALDKKLPEMFVDCPMVKGFYLPQDKKLCEIILDCPNSRAFGFAIAV